MSIRKIYSSVYTAVLRGTCSRCLKKLKVLPKIHSNFGLSYYSTTRVLPRITVFPDNVLIDEQVQVVVEGLESNQEVTLKASVSENKQTFSSYGCFKADSSGVLDLQKHESFAGTYTGLDNMGLFWSMQPDPGQQSGRRLMKKEVTTPLTAHLSVHKDHLSWDQLFKGDLHPIASGEVNRWYKGRDIKREDIRVGNIRGTLFTPPGPGPFPGIIDTFGSAGGLIECRASLLASKGYCVLALAFFLHDDLPKKLDNLSLDYFKESIEWFSTHSSVQKGGIGFLGSSKGAELGFLASVHCPQIKAFVSVNGLPFCSFFPLRHGTEYISSAENHFELCVMTEKGLKTRDCFVLDDSQFTPAWKSDMKVLSLIAGDDMCVSPEYNHRFHRLIPEDRKKNYEMIVYHGAGHLLEPPYSPHCEFSHHKVLGINIFWGGNPKDHNTAQVDAWQRALQFLRTHLSPAQ